MRIEPTAIPEVKVVAPAVYRDGRGFFLETWHGPRYAEVGLGGPWVQDNVSRSERGVLRGLHIQNPHAQGKLVSVLQGRVYDVAVDLRLGSPTFRAWVGVELDDRSMRQLWVPPGFAHGFVVLSEEALFAYKCTDVYVREAEFGVRWDDPDLGIDWPIESPVLSEKDAALPLLGQVPADRLVRYRGGAG